MFDSIYIINTIHPELFERFVVAPRIHFINVFTERCEFYPIQRI